MRAAKTKVFFVTGTDTSVGKTAVSCLLCCEARKQGLRVGVMKPYASGSWNDTRLLKRASGSASSLRAITPIFFKTPAAPWAAAQKERVQLSRPALDKIFLEAKKSCDVLFVEGMGGLLVPIAENYFVTDLIMRWNVEVILVARWGLGTLNHTLLSLEALEKRKIPVTGIILNQCSPAPIGFVEKTNQNYFLRRKQAPLLATARYAPVKKRQLNWKNQIVF